MSDDINVFELMEKHPWRMWWFRFRPKFWLMEKAAPLFRGRAKRWGQRLARPGAALVVDGGPSKPEGNWLGAVRVGRKGEEWPRSPAGVPLSPVLQLDVSTSPFVPEALKGIKLLTLFVAPRGPSTETDVCLPEWDEQSIEHGKGWCIRTYRTGVELVPIVPPKGTRLAKGCAMRWRPLAADEPNVLADLCKAKFPTRLAYEDTEHSEATKLGGWPTFLQGRWRWRPWAAEPLAPTYVFQVTSSHEAGIIWCDMGIAAFGVHDDGRWEMTWTCH